MLVMPLRITQVDTKVLVFLVHIILSSLLHRELPGNPSSLHSPHSPTLAPLAPKPWGSQGGGAPRVKSRGFFQAWSTRSRVAVPKFRAPASGHPERKLDKGKGMALYFFNPFQIKKIKSPSPSRSCHGRLAATRRGWHIWETLPLPGSAAAPLSHRQERGSPGGRTGARCQEDSSGGGSGGEESRGAERARPPPSDKRHHQSRSGSGEGPVLGGCRPTGKARREESGAPAPPAGRPPAPALRGCALPLARAGAGCPRPETPRGSAHTASRSP